jgi:DNA topoisomerase-3
MHLLWACSISLTVFAGPCQFPTLGFVVSRYNQVQAFVPETFHYIYLSHSKGQPSKQTEFKWRRDRIFDLEIAVALYAPLVQRNPQARVTRVTQKTTKKWYVPHHFDLLFVNPALAGNPSL